MKCDNCSNAALYTVADPGVNPVYYCAKCLPTWLSARAASGQLNLPKPEKPASKKKAEAEEAPADADN